MSDEHDTPDTVLKTEHLRRMAAKQSKVESLEAELRDIREQLASVPDPGKSAKRLEKAEAERDRIRQEFDSFKSESETRSAILAAGITDPEDIALVRWRHERIPEDKRPDLSAWLGSEAKEDRHLASLLGASPEPTAEPAPEPDTSVSDTGRLTAAGAPRANLPGRRPASALPRANAGVKPSSAPPKEWSMEYVLGMSYEDRGKPENRQRVMAALRGEDA